MLLAIACICAVGVLVIIRTACCINSGFCSQTLLHVKHFYSVLQLQRKALSKMSTCIRAAMFAPALPFCPMPLAVS